MGDYIEPYRCSWQGSGCGCGDVSKVCGSGGEGLSSIEGAECEDFDDRETGVGRPDPSLREERLLGMTLRRLV